MTIEGAGLPGWLDLCITCGKRVSVTLWGKGCEAGHSAVHLQPCNGCGRLCGQVTDDDYCGPDLLYCPDCIEAAIAKARSGE